MTLVRAPRLAYHVEPNGDIKKIGNSSINKLVAPVSD